MSVAAEINVWFTPTSSILLPHRPWRRGAQIVYSDSEPWAISDTLNIDGLVLFDMTSDGRVSRIEFLHMESSGDPPSTKRKRGHTMYVSILNKNAVEETVVISETETKSGLIINFSNQQCDREVEIGVGLFAQLSGESLRGLRYAALAQ